MASVYPQMGGRDNEWFPQSNNLNAPRRRNYNSDTFASDTYADLVRTEYEESKRFKPYEQELMSLADGEALLNDQLSKITGASTRKFAQAKTNSEMMNQRYGVTSSQRQDNSNNTQLDAQRGLAISQAKNMSRLASEDRKLGVLSGAGVTRQNAMGGDQ
jgi:hypothetical protein